jgi:hypothetical protein
MIKRPPRGDHQEDSGRAPKQKGGRPKGKRSDPLILWKVSIAIAMHGLADIGRFGPRNQIAKLATLLADPDTQLLDPALGSEPFALALIPAPNRAAELSNATRRTAQVFSGSANNIAGYWGKDAGFVISSAWAIFGLFVTHAQAVPFVILRLEQLGWATGVAKAICKFAVYQNGSCDDFFSPHKQLNALRLLDDFFRRSDEEFSILAFPPVHEQG